MAKTVNNRVVVWKAQDMIVPIAYLNLVLQTRPVFGFGLARDGKLIHSLPKKVSGESITKGFTNIKEPALFVFDVDGTQEGDRQPFLALTNSKADPLCYAAVEGELLGYDKMEDTRSDAYHFKEDYLITKLEEYYKLLGEDIDKLSDHLLKSDALKNDIAKAFGSFGSLTLLFNNGKNIEIVKHGGNGHTYTWGHTTDALGFGLTPTKLEDPLASLELELEDAGEDIDMEADLATLNTGESKLIPAGEVKPLVPVGDLIKGAFKGFSDFLKDTMEKNPEKYPEISPMDDKTIIQKNGTIRENGKEVQRDLCVADYATMLKTNPNDPIASRVIKKWYETKQGHKNGQYKTLPRIHTVEQKNEIRLIYDAMEAERKKHNDVILLARSNAEKTETALSAAMAAASQAKDGKPIASTTSLTSQQQAKEAGDVKFKKNVKGWTDKNCQVLSTDPNYLKNKENGLNRFSSRAGVNWDQTLGTSRKALNDLLKECGSDALLDLACEWQYELTKLHLADVAAVEAELASLQEPAPKKMHNL